MDRHLIKSLIDALAASDLSELEFSQDGATLRLVKFSSNAMTAVPAPVLPFVTASPAEAAPTVSAEEDHALTAPFCSPLFGVVHLAPGPEAPRFVQPGQAVKAGDVLCVVEAMKAFTELRAETPATIAAVLVETGQEVEAGQPLFRFA